MSLFTPGLQTYSILAASLAAGANLTTSIITFPALLHATGPTLTQQWLKLYEFGLVPVASTTLTASLGFATLAYRAVDAGSSTKRNLYVAAAVALFGLVPYTRLLMWGTIAELTKRAQTEKEHRTDSRALVERWGRLNFWRGIMLLAGAGSGVWASVL